MVRKDCGDSQFMRSVVEEGGGGEEAAEGERVPKDDTGDDDDDGEEEEEEMADLLQLEYCSLQHSIVERYRYVGIRNGHSLPRRS